MEKTVILAVFAHGGGKEGGEEKGIKVLSEAANFLGASTNATSRLLPIPTYLPSLHFPATLTFQLALRM